jgi:hypothetical protein
MTAFEDCEIQVLRVDLPIDFKQEIAALRHVGADQFDPVRLHYLEVLTQRANEQQGSVKRILEAKLTQAVVDFRARFAQAQGDAKVAIARVVPQYPQAVDDLHRLLNAADFKGVTRIIATLKNSVPRTTLGDLIRSIEQQTPAHVKSRLDGDFGTKTELKSVRYFRNTWSKLSVDKQVKQALGQAPKNAGPINSHRLVLDSLALMRDISPDYLNRFVSYVDTLLCLDQHNEEKLVQVKAVAEAAKSTKTKARRARTR